MTTTATPDLFLSLKRRLASRKMFVVTFTKQDGTMRTMRLQYTGGLIRGTMMQVRDLDKDAIRTVNLATIHTLGEVKPKTFDPSRMTCEEIADLF